MIRRSVLAVVATSAVLLGCVVVSATAGATVGSESLPGSDSMFAIDCGSSPGQLNSVDPATAAFTPIGSTHNIDGSNCGYGMAYNPITTKSYVLAGNNNSVEWPIVEVDLTNGTQTEISRIMINGSPATEYPAVMTFDASGDAYVVVNNTLYTLDITTGDATVVGAVGPIGTFGAIYAFAFNPVDGNFYAVGENGQLLSIDISSGAGTLIVQLQLASGVYSLQFDSDCSGWLNTGANSMFAISSFDLSDPQGTIVDSSADATTYSGAYLIVPSVTPTPRDCGATPPTTSTTTTIMPPSTSSTTIAPSDPVAPAFTG